MSTVATTSSTILLDDPALVGAWMTQHGVPWREGATCIGLVRQGQLVAATMYDAYNGISICAHIVIRGPITREWLRAIVRYPFDQLGCHVIFGVIAQDNLRSQRFVRHFGFHLHTIIPDADPSGALLLYTLRPHQCRWLRRPSHG